MRGFVSSVTSIAIYQYTYVLCIIIFCERDNLCFSMLPIIQHVDV